MLDFYSLFNFLSVECDVGGNKCPYDPLAQHTVRRNVHCVTEEEKCGAVTASDLNTVIVLSWQITLDFSDHSLNERIVLSFSSSSLCVTSNVVGFFPSLLC